MQNPLTSRKLWMAIASILSIAAVALGGGETWHQATTQIVYVVLAYLGFQGAIDFAGVVSPNAATPPVFDAPSGTIPTDPCPKVAVSPLVYGILDQTQQTKVTVDPIAASQQGQPLTPAIPARVPTADDLKPDYLQTIGKIVNALGDEMAVNFLGHELNIPDNQRGEIANLLAQIKMKL